MANTNIGINTHIRVHLNKDRIVNDFIFFLVSYICLYMYLTVYVYSKWVNWNKLRCILSNFSTITMQKTTHTHKTTEQIRILHRLAGIHLVTRIPPRRIASIDTPTINYLSEFRIAYILYIYALWDRDTTWASPVVNSIVLILCVWSRVNMVIIFIV